MALLCVLHNVQKNRRCIFVELMDEYSAMVVEQNAFCSGSPAPTLPGYGQSS